MQDASADVAPDATLAAPRIVRSERHLPHCLVDGTVDIDLRRLAHVILEEIRQLVDIVENRLCVAQQKILIRLQTCLCSW